MEVLGPGIIQYVSPEMVIASRGHDLYCSYDSGQEWDLWCSLPVSTLDHFFSSNRWLSRLTRKEVYHVQQVTNQMYICFGVSFICLIEKSTGNVEKIGSIIGSRPLKVCANAEYIYYGVYKRNRQREPVQVFAYSLETREWSVLFTFENIRHIHGAFWDTYRSKLWITTGDLDHESSIIRFDNSEPAKIVSGSQQFRAVDLLFSKNSIFFATDAPNEVNHIYRLDRENSSIRKLQKVGGPVFWGRQENGWLFFSTVVEPSPVNRTDAAELWASADKGKTWKKITELKKDMAPMKLFQYGQIKFPAGPGDGKYCWFTPYATKYDHQIMRIKFDDLKCL